MLFASADYKVGDLSALLNQANEEDAAPSTLFDKPNPIQPRPKKSKKKLSKAERVEASVNPDLSEETDSRSSEQQRAHYGQQQEPLTEEPDSEERPESPRPARTLNKHALKKRKRRELAEVEAREAENFEGEDPGKKKKKITKEEKDSEDEEPEKEETKKKKKKAEEESPDRLARTLFVGNLPPDAKRRLKNLQKLFAQFGELDSIRLRGFVAADPKISKRVSAITGDLHQKVQTLHGYVVFKQAEEAEKAKTLDGTVFAERHLRVTGSGKETPNSKLSVFVGNLPFDVSDEALHQVFSESCGDVASVRVIRDASSRMGKGFGYVAFRSMGAVVAAVKASETLTIAGRPLRIKKATPKAGEGASNKTFMGDSGKKQKVKKSTINRGKSRRDLKKKKKGKKGLVKL